MGDEAGRNRGIQTVSQLQAFQEEYAQNAIGLMPPNQFEALVQQATRDLQAG
jgi:hypothetical protein